MIYKDNIPTYVVLQFFPPEKIAALVKKEEEKYQNWLLNGTTKPLEIGILAT